VTPIGSSAFVKLGDLTFQSLDAMLLCIDALLQQLHPGLEVCRFLPDFMTPFGKATAQEAAEQSNEQNAFDCRFHLEATPFCKSSTWLFQ
jgi:hypothetical protein